MGTKFKSAPAAQKKREWLGELRVLQKVNEFEFAVELDVMRDSVNRNNWDYQNLAEYYKTFSGRPILIAYVGKKVGDGHNSDIVIDPKTGKQRRSYMGATAQRIVGKVSEDEKDISLIEQGGHTWIRAQGIIWAFYAPELVEKIVRAGRMEVSAETNVLEEHKDGNVDVFIKWYGIGETILGDDVEPAIPGANIHALAALEQEFKQAQLRAASLRKEAGKPQNNNFGKEGVKNGMGANKTLEKMMSAKFPEYRVMAFSEDGMNVCLQNKENGETFKYAFSEEDKGAVVAERIRPVSLSANVEVGGATLSVGFDDISEGYVAQIAELSAALKKAEQERDNAKQRAEDAETREKARRIKASRQAAENELLAINANREEAERVDAALIAPVLTMADNGEFVGCADANGEWTGEDRARSMVRDIAMQRQMELDKARVNAAQQARKKQ